LAFQAQEEPEFFPGSADQILFADNLRPGILDRYLGRQNIIFGGYASGILPLRFIQVADFLLQGLNREGIELSGKQDVIEGSGNVPQRRLPEKAQLVIGRSQAYFGRPEGRPYLPEGVKSLGETNLQGTSFALQWE
jgi:hypothetical protein